MWDVGMGIDKCVMNTYGRILPRVVVMGILAESAAPIQLDEELVVIPP